MPVISATNLSIGYKGSPIVSNINLRLSTGRIICLLGANGAGKTTLMKTLLGRIKPVSGEVTYTGTNINEMSAAIDHPSCVCSIESGPCERVESLQMSGRF